MANSEAPGDVLRERAGGSRLRLWLLLEADRRLVTALLLFVVFATFLAVGALLPAAAASVRASDSVDTLFQALLTATITGVTLVVTLNQLVLSQELGAVGDQRERMEGAMAFRDDVAEVIEAPVSPARPAQFLRALVQVAGERARDLRAATPDRDGDLGDAIDELTDGLIENADRVAAGLDDARFGEFDVVASALDFNYSFKIFAARRLRGRHGEALDGEADAALEELLSVLELFGPAREHFKTLYFQWDLIDLSRHILLTAIPALLVSGTMVAFVSADRFVGVVGGVDVLIVVVSLAATVSVAPFLVLLAYVLRIATVAKHTLSVGPFILRESEAVGGVEWDD